MLDSSREAVLRLDECGGDFGTQIASLLGRAFSGLMSSAGVGCMPDGPRAGDTNFGRLLNEVGVLVGPDRVTSSLALIFLRTTKFNQYFPFLVSFPHYSTQPTFFCCAATILAAS